MELDYTSPRNSKNFTRYWNTFINDIKDRPNLKPSHLYQLQVLCDLCVDYDELRDTIELLGRTYSSGGTRHGDQLKITPEVQQLNKVISEIRNYSKILGLILHNDTKTKEDEEDENDFK